MHSRRLHARPAAGTLVSFECARTSALTVLCTLPQRSVARPPTGGLGKGPRGPIGPHEGALGGPQGAPGGPRGALWGPLGPHMGPLEAPGRPPGPYRQVVIGMAPDRYFYGVIFIGSGGRIGPWGPWAQAQGPRAGTQGPGTGPRDQGPGPGTRGQGPGTRDQGPGARGQGPGALELERKDY